MSDSNNIIKKKLKITNRGNERGFFEIIKNPGDEAVQFSSYSGFVEPKNEIHLTAKMIADCRKEINEEIKINLGDRTERVKITGSVISRKLRLNTEILQLGDFVASAQGRETVFLENPTPDSIQWISKIPFEADGVEIGPFESANEVIQIIP